MATPSARASQLARGASTTRYIPKAATSGMTSKNKPARRFWHQGFGTIIVDGREVVPFEQQHTAERIAGQASRRLKKTMKVRLFGDLWCYFQEEK